MPHRIFAMTVLVNLLILELREDWLGESRMELDMGDKRLHGVRVADLQEADRRVNLLITRQQK